MIAGFYLGIIVWGRKLRQGYSPKRQTENVELQITRDINIQEAREQLKVVCLFFKL